MKWFLNAGESGGFALALGCKCSLDKTVNAENLQCPDPAAGFLMAEPSLQKRVSALNVLPLMCRAGGGRSDSPSHVGRSQWISSSCWAVRKERGRFVLCFQELLGECLGDFQLLLATSVKGLVSLW